MANTARSSCCASAEDAISLSGLALAGEGNGPGGLIGVELSLLLQLAATIPLAALATLSAARGWKALHPSASS